MQQPHNKSDSKVIGLPYSYVYTTSRATTTRSDIPLSDQEYIQRIKSLYIGNLFANFIVAKYIIYLQSDLSKTCVPTK